jgi:integration host factor subunit beta
MATTKRELVKRIAKATGQKQDVTKEIIQTFLDQIIEELAAGNRLEFREFGVFDIVHKKPRVARNPRTGETVHVPAKRMVHFKVGRLMKKRVMGEVDADGNPVAQHEQAGGTAPGGSAAAPPAGSQQPPPAGGEAGQTGGNP